LDLHPTSLISQCPGIVVHGAIYNAILTGKMWRQASDYTGWVITAGMGLVTILLVMTLPPALSFAAALGLALGYLAFNGYFLFARENLIVAAAGPLVAVLLVWSGLTLSSFVSEIAEHARIKRRFRSYVDPAVVNWMVEHPESTHFDGERREMTVGFSDLAGFTTMTDEMGERVVPLLAEYMGQMVPVIRSHNGRIAQLSGDGIYFFFGAPEPDERHAEYAVKTALEMHKSLEQFNTMLRQRGGKTLGMRIGISTGEVVIGDAGAPSANASAYTAMGATTNLASRLESANKVFGTRTLIVERTVELLNAEYLVRPIANLRVAGKLDRTVVYEPICHVRDATEQDHLLAEYTGKIFQTYRNADFSACIAAAHVMQQTFGLSKLTDLYLRLSIEHHDRASLVEHCEGQIVLTEK
jgi:adenylate cyclase